MKRISLINLVVLSLALIAHAEDQPTTKQATGTITGTVLDASGNPAKGCIVAAQQSARKMRIPLDATTDDKGEFKIENVPEGEYNLKIRTSDAKGKVTKTVKVLAGKTVDTGKLKLKSK